ncbi:MAG: ABC transporter ATP-binding protein [Thermoprotei archaeon]|nr:MAG: ABC transporter ATP-binding protein [Thermoprotei archaeon]
MYTVETENLVKFFERIEALRGLTMHVPKGISGFIGPNGAGKTTTINILAGLVKPDKGSARVLDLDVVKESLEIRRRARFMLENQTLPSHLTIEKYMKYIAFLYNADFREINKALKIVGLEKFRHRLIGSLSAGMMQRLRFAQTLLGESELIILDEPTANLDPLGRIEILEKIVELNKDRNISFLLSSHILPELEKIVNWVSIINEGKIVAEGKLSDIISPQKYSEFKIFSSDNYTLANLLKDYGYEIEVEENYILVKASEAWNLYKTLALLTDYNINIYKIETVGASLEEVFKKLVRK